jgi:hypothetical protein
MRLSSTKYVSEIAVTNVLLDAEYVQPYVEVSTSSPYFLDQNFSKRTKRGTRGGESQ